MESLGYRGVKIMVIRERQGSAHQPVPWKVNVMNAERGNEEPTPPDGRIYTVESVLVERHWAAAISS